MPRPEKPNKTSSGLSSKLDKRMLAYAAAASAAGIEMAGLAPAANVGAGGSVAGAAAKKSSFLISFGGSFARAHKNQWRSNAG